MLKNYFSHASFKRNIYTSTILNLLLVFGIFSISRILFYLFNASFFTDITFFGFMRMMMGGLKFDTTAILYTNLPYLLLALLPFTFRYHAAYQNILKYLFITTNSIAILANCADIVYFRFTFRRTTATVFSEFAGEQNKGSLLSSFLVDYWYIFLIWIAFTFLLIILYRKGKLVSKPKGLVQKSIYSAMGTVLMVLFFGLTLAGLRGGFKHSTRPISLNNAGAFVNQPLETTIVLNTPFAIYRTLGKTPLVRIRFYSDEQELEKIYSPLHYPKPADSFKEQNVVIIILESFGREYIGAYNPIVDRSNYQGYTPFLDSLMDYSLVYNHSFSNGRKSIDALPAIFASIPMVAEPFVLTPYSTNKLNSVASTLKKKGYYSSFFHGAPNGSMGFQAFTNLVDFDAYFGKNEYGNSAHYDGIWGIWDEEFLQFFAEKIETFPQPFITSVFTVSSHHPFKVPSRYEGVFPKGELPIHQCIGYTDYALKRFFETIKEKPWFENTLFVITADHPNESAYEEYKTTLGVFSVPIIFHHPKEMLVGRENRVAQHIDIMPSILGYLNYDEPYLAFGKDLFADSTQNFVLNYTNSIYQYISTDTLLLFNGEKITGAFDFINDPLLQKNLLQEGKYPNDSQDKFLKAIIQQYHNRLIDGQMQP